MLSRLGCAAALACVSFVASIASAQLLPPPGPIAQSNRTIIRQQGILAFPYVITTPGSYVLASDIFGTPGVPAIQIQTSDVTLDLNGFTISGGRNGIEIIVGMRGVSISNGGITGASLTGIEGAFASQVRLTDVRLNSNGDRGAYLGDEAAVTRCTAQFNTSTGIRTGNNAVITECTARDNFNGPGIFAGFYAAITGCTTQNNGQGGIACFESSTIDNCTARQNGFTAPPFNWPGINADQGSTIRGSTADGNAGFGIVLQARGNILDSSAKNNLQGGIGCGYSTTVQRCSAHDNGPVPPGPIVDGGGTAKHRPAPPVPGAVVAGEVEADVPSGVITSREGARTFFVDDGISTGDGCLVVACDTQGNTDVGIAVLIGTNVLDCISRFNGNANISTTGSSTIRDCTVSYGYTHGIDAGEGSIVEGCISNRNDGYGILASNNTVIRKNTLDTNNWTGVFVAGFRNRIEDNHSLNNLQWGYEIFGSQNTVFRNTATSNSFGNYNLGFGNITGNIQFMFGGGVVFTSEPWANFEY